MILLRQTRCALSRQGHIAYFHASPAWWAARKVLQRFKLADIGEGITECEVIKWYVFVNPECYHRTTRVFPSHRAFYGFHRSTFSVRCA